MSEILDSPESEPIESQNELGPEVEASSLEDTVFENDASVPEPELGTTDEVVSAPSDLIEDSTHATNSVVTPEDSNQISGSNLVEEDIDKADPLIDGLEDDENSVSSSELSPAISQVKSVSPEEVRSKIGELKASIDSQIYQIDENYDATEKAQERRERLLSVQEEFKDWIGARQASYAWKLMEQLRSHQTALSKDEGTLRDFVNEEDQLEFGFSERTRKWFMRHFMSNFSVSWGLIFALYLLHRYAQQISDWVTQSISNNALQSFLSSAIENIIGPGFWRIASYIFAASLFHFVALLFAYSRRMSEYSRHVAVEAARTKAMDLGIHAVREARERLDSLHPQIPQILELLSLGLHQPWKLTEEDLLFSAAVPDASLMPASVEISVPTISKSSPIYEELVFKTMNEIQIPGWRADAFSLIMERIAHSLGFGQNGLALRELDEDQRRKGKRELVLESSSEEKPFRDVGAELLEKFTAITQAKIIPTVQPEVVSLKPDPLANLDLSGTLLPEDSESVSKWEEKLAEIAGHAAPWSSGTFSIAGASAKKHESLESIFLASERVQSLAVDEVEAHAEVRPGSRPFEVAIRVDLSEWCKPFEVGIFEDFVPSNEQIQRWNQAETSMSRIEDTTTESEQVDGSILL